MCLIGVIIGTYTGTFTVVGPIIQAFTIDFGIQSSQIANRSAIYAIEPKARNRVNTAFMVSAFCGQLIGTAVGNRLYAEGGWIASGSASIGFVCTALVVCFARAPWEKGWVGWRGGWSVRRRDLDPKAESDEETAQSSGQDVRLEEQEMQSNAQEEGSKAEPEELGRRDDEKCDENPKDIEKAYEADMSDEEKKASSEEAMPSYIQQ